MVWSLLALIYIAYPVGCALQVLDNGSAPSLELKWAGFASVGAAFAAFLVLAGTNLQRLAQEKADALDERELMKRNQAFFRAYSTLSGVVLLGCIYLNLAPDVARKLEFGMWRPHSADDWSMIFWGLFLLMMTLPIVFLTDESEPADNEQD